MAMFSVIISEKGGAERRESFDRTEINVGRVQGNDLMLPKGNVSKRHARLLFRDGRFIVTDLKSTNGTYVNGRKISQATIVREGDKIYIGDFVLRIETTSSAAPPASDPPPARADEPSGGSAIPAAPDPTPGQVPIPKEPSHLPVEPPSSSESRNAGRSGPPRVDSPSALRGDIVSHFPLEHDPDDSMQYQVPGPPRVPSGARALVPSRSGSMPSPTRQQPLRPARRPAPAFVPPPARRPPPPSPRPRRRDEPGPA
ncbi:MAG: FHA domain-containing protein [Polyangiaceae bacterium]